MTAPRYVVVGTDVLDQETGLVALFQHAGVAQLGADWLNGPHATPEDYGWTEPGFAVRPEQKDAPDAVAAARGEITTTPSKEKMMNDNQTTTVPEFAATDVAAALACIDSSPFGLIEFEPGDALHQEVLSVRVKPAAEMRGYEVGEVVHLGLPIDEDGRKLPSEFWRDVETQAKEDFVLRTLLRNWRGAPNMGMRFGDVLGVSLGQYVVAGEFEDADGTLLVELTAHTAPTAGERVAPIYGPSDARWGELAEYMAARPDLFTEERGNTVEELEPGERGTWHAKYIGGRDWRDIAHSGFVYPEFPESAPASWADQVDDRGTESCTDRPMRAHIRDLDEQVCAAASIEREDVFDPETGTVRHGEVFLSVWLSDNVGTRFTDPAEVRRTARALLTAADELEAVLVKANALRFGLCERCAAQVAWAHQAHTGGFDAARPPCAACADPVALLPRSRGNGWRSVAGDAKDSRNWPGSVTGASEATVTPGSDTSDVNAAPVRDSGGISGTARGGAVVNPLEQATAIAQRIVQIANSENLGDLRGEMIHETITEELMTSAKDPFRFVRACAVLQLLGIALVEITDEAKRISSEPPRILRRSTDIDDEFRERDV